jgi:DNA-binding NarL/FixJ family response regulator
MVAADRGLARVLLVDDHGPMRARIKTVLQQTHDVVGTAASGEAALAAAAALHPDVIVLDITMPGMTGFEVASRLRASQSTAAVVFLTVNEDEEHLLAARAAGGLGFVIKPRLQDDLLVAVREALAGRWFASRLGSESF